MVGEPSGGQACASKLRVFPWGDDEPGADTPIYVNLGDLLACAALDIDCSDNPLAAYIDGHPTTAPVSSLPDGRSPYGAHHMSGNVCEWVADTYQGPQVGYTGAPSDGSAWSIDPFNMDYHLLRGGSFKTGVSGTGISAIRAAYRYEIPGGESYDAFGFRCCRWIED